jgi:hypothetical protein
MAKQGLTVTRKFFLNALAPTALAAVLAGCTTPAWVSPVEVTRFVGQAPAQLGQGTIAVVPAPGLVQQGLDYSLYEAQLAAALTALGYRVVNNTSASQIATLSFIETVDQAQRRSPVSVGGNAGVGSYGSGVGLGLGIDLTPPPADQIARQVSVTIRASDAGQNLWEGRARFTATANHAMANPAAAAARTVDALFAGFPGNSGETVVVQ